MAKIYLSGEEYTDRVEEIRALVEAATRDWTDADWPHERMFPCDAPEHDTHTPCPGCGAEYDENGDAVMCDGTEDCQTCDDATSAAAEAAACGQCVLELLAAKEIECALDSADAACELEAQFGDDPTWRPVKEAVESLLEDNDAAGSEIDEGESEADAEEQQRLGEMIDAEREADLAARRDYHEEE